MKIKLEPYLCYLAGLQSRSRSERNSIGIVTSMPELEEKFIDIALKKLKIEPSHVIIREEDGMHRVFFYHSKLGGQLRKISKDCAILFKLPTPQTRSYLAGIFDASGHITNGDLSVKGLTLQETVMLQGLGIHISGPKLREANRFLALIKGFSVTADVMLQRKKK